MLVAHAIWLGDGVAEAACACIVQVGNNVDATAASSGRLCAEPCMVLSTDIGIQIGKGRKAHLRHLERPGELGTMWTALLGVAIRSK
jgi:hypothetical protein